MNFKLFCAKFWTLKLFFTTEVRHTQMCLLFSFAIVMLSTRLPGSQLWRVLLGGRRLSAGECPHSPTSLFIANVNFQHNQQRNAVKLKRWSNIHCDTLFLSEFFAKKCPKMHILNSEKNYLYKKLEEKKWGLFSSTFNVDRAIVPEMLGQNLLKTPLENSKTRFSQIPPSSRGFRN